ncbi:MAG TPA: hypothetical protein VK003_18765, partial [Oceanobacillus sp.]|nr:hypothetical protein [Oceanobacillus sp.]
MSAVAFLFEHFYHGQLLQGGTLQGEPRLLALSPGVRNEQVAAALQEAPIPPQSGMGAWALVRGKTIPFLLVQSQPGMRHYILVTVDALRALGGNHKALLDLVEPEIKKFETTGHSLPPLMMPNVGFPSSAAQEEAMLDLMTATRDRLDVIEALLAAIIHGVQIVVKGAPPELEKRVGFVEGLLALLPPPARFGVTFTTYSTPDIILDSQICFYGDEHTPPENTLVYQWGQPDVSGVKAEDEYARFIKSQLRLDTGLVIEQTTALTPVAGWRIREGEALAEALKYASYRLKVDNALLNHQPVGAPEVAKVLAEDPTLTPELRAVYIQHLLAFALVLGDDENSDLLANAAQGQPDLERAILREMSEALNDGKAEHVFRRVSLWRRRPEGFQGMYWQELVQRAAVAYAQTLAQSGDPEALNTFLDELRDSMSPVEMAAIATQLIEITLPLSTKHRKLAETVFVLSASALATERLQRLMASRALVAQLPAGMRELIAYMAAAERTPPPQGMLAQAISDFGTQWRPLLFIRLAEIVVLAGLYELLDQSAMQGLAEAATSAWGDAYDTTLRWTVRTLSTDEILATLEPASRQALLQILLGRRAYADVANELQKHSRLFYPADKQLQFAQMAYNLLAESPLPLTEIPVALQTLTEKGVKPLPLAMAHFGALQRNHWPPALEAVAASVTDLIYNNRLIAEALPPDMLMELLNYHVERQDTNLALRVAHLLPASAARRGDAGITVMIQMYRIMNWNDEGRAAALDGLRRYIRRGNDTLVQQALSRLGRELGDQVRQALEATVTLYQMMGGEDIGDYAYSLHTVSEFLYDTSLAYMDKNSAPNVTSLLSDLDSLAGGLSNDERRALSTAM